MGAPVVAASAHGIPSHDGDPLAPVIVKRVTRSNRTLFYCLNVIQQPERARACGSGPKSSADRRPVDPPPVVELRIYEGETWETARSKDVTFLYNANFFLYATLEHARVMAHGRVQTPAANSPPVLTGMPVSGMAYLDRPEEAGYFLFPDLSVRHEGRYRLTFNLYEETKEDDDKDADSADGKLNVPGMSSATGGSFDFRMEVKSQDFVVYSAKKFPGLTESTHLSRMVAEQGCRVRIRRDVRMRRRDGKGGGGGGGGGGAAEYENPAEDEFVRRRRTATPDTQSNAYNRQRSTSGSVERTPYSADSQRRPSMADYPPQYPAQAPSSGGGHLQFLGGNAKSQYPAQPQSFAQPPSVPASPGYPPSQGSSSYPSQPSYSLPPPPPSQPAYVAERTLSQSSSYAPIVPTPPRRESGHEYRPSTSAITLPPIFQQRSSTPSTNALPPIKVDVGSGISGRPLMASPSPTTGRPGQFSGGPASAGLGRPPQQYAGTKRAHDESFRPDEIPRYQDGARDSGVAEDKDNSRMVYRRAAGHYNSREAPTST